MKEEFETKLIELGISFQVKPDNFYILSTINGVERKITVRLICSKLVNPLKYGSNNGNEIESIGLFRFQLNPWRNESDFITFAFLNSVKHQIEYIIVPTELLKHRLIKGTRIRSETHLFKTVFWLMPDGFVYNCSSLGIEVEWYFMSKGINGRMADRTEWNYTEYLNRWDRLKRIKS